MAINGRDSVDQCMTILRELEDGVKGARKGFINGDSCVISRRYLEEKIEQMHANLPDALRQAETMLREESQIRAQTDQECKDRLTHAQSQAQQLVADAQRQLTQAQAEVQQAQAQAERTVQDAARRAQEEAARILQQARSDADAMHAQAEAECRELVSEENVYRMATVEADELRENVHKELTEIRQNTFDYLDHMMAEADRMLSELVNDVRMERGEFSKRRDGRPW